MCHLYVDQYHLSCIHIFMGTYCYTKSDIYSIKGNWFLLVFSSVYLHLIMFEVFQAISFLMWFIFNIFSIKMQIKSSVIKIIHTAYGSLSQTWRKRRGKWYLHFYYFHDCYFHIYCSYQPLLSQLHQQVNIKTWCSSKLTFPKTGSQTIYGR